jgi:hypothetical protein
VIANALREQLIETNRERVECFLDTMTIESGKQWEKELHDWLQNADWLVCVYTGDQSEFCGYEVGVWRQTKGLTADLKDPRLVCLYDVDSVPTVYHKHQNKQVQFPPEADRDPSFNEEDFYWKSPLKEFLIDFCEYKDLYVARDAAEGERQRRTVTRQAKIITDAFKAARASDVRSTTPTQLRIEIEVPAAPGSTLQKIPDEAEASGTFQSLGLFGLMPPLQGKQMPRTTWARIRQSSGLPDTAVIPWMKSLEMDMLTVCLEAQPARLTPSLTLRFIGLRSGEYSGHRP